MSNRADSPSRASSAKVPRSGYASAVFTAPPKHQQQQEQHQLILSVTSGASPPPCRRRHRYASLALCCHMTAWFAHGPNHTEEMITGQEVAA